MKWSVALCWNNLHNVIVLSRISNHRKFQIGLRICGWQCCLLCCWWLWDSWLHSSFTRGSLRRKSTSKWAWKSTRWLRIMSAWLNRSPIQNKTLTLTTKLLYELHKRVSKTTLTYPTKPSSRLYLLSHLFNTQYYTFIY